MSRSDKKLHALKHKGLRHMAPLSKSKSPLCAFIIHQFLSLAFLMLMLLLRHPICSHISLLCLHEAQHGNRRCSVTSRRTISLQRSTRKTSCHHQVKVWHQRSGASSLLPKLAMQPPCDHHLRFPNLEMGSSFVHGYSHFEVPPGHHQLYLPALETTNVLIHRYTKRHHLYTRKSPERPRPSKLRLMITGSLHYPQHKSSRRASPSYTFMLAIAYY